MSVTGILNFIQTNGPSICEAVLAIAGGLKVIFHYLPPKYENPLDRVLNAIAIPFRWLLAILMSNNDNGPTQGPDSNAS